MIKVNVDEEKARLERLSEVLPSKSFCAHVFTDEGHYIWMY